MANLYVRDVRSPWGRVLAETAQARGWNARKIERADDIDGPGFGFIRIHPHPAKIRKDKRLGLAMLARLSMVQDEAQILAYDDKCEQYRRWGRWMPPTWLFEDLEAALDFAETAQFPLVSKAAVGASSQNIRIFEFKDALVSHLRQVFGFGVLVRHGSGDGCRTKQKGYALLQAFVPHEVTYRVNVIGRQRVVFHRFCYPDRPMAQTGNVKPVYRLGRLEEDLLAYAEGFVKETGTRWCALDILRDGTDWKLLETSLAWPHPSPGDCNNGTFFPSGRKWIDMWGVLLDEMETWRA